MIKRIFSGRVPEVNTRRVCEVEHVEQYQSQQHFLHQSLADRIQTGGAFLAAEGEQVDHESCEDDGSEDDKHEIAVSDKIGPVIYRVDPVRGVSLGLQQPSGHAVIPDIQVKSIGSF